LSRQRRQAEPDASEIEQFAIVIEMQVPPDRK